MVIKRTVILCLVAIVVIIPLAFAIVSNQYDNFEDGTTQGWGSGVPNPTPPVNVTTGGPGGANDNFLQVASSGGAGAGSKLVIINSAQWTGNYVAAGVQYVSMYIKNFGSTSLNMRIALRGAGGDFWSVNSVVVPASSNWQPIVFSVKPADLTGGTNINSTLSGVTTVRILHSVAGGFNGDPIAAQIGLDNITAAAQPLPVELISFSADVAGAKVKLQWSTSTETNNLRFEIQRSFNQTGWQTIGNVMGNGTTTQNHHYSFYDDMSNYNSSKIFYRLKQIDFNGSFTFSNVISVDNNVISFELRQNYPNPFNPSTKISWQSPLSSWQTLKVYDVIGNEVATLVDEYKPAGNYEAEFNASNLSSGVYFYQIKAGTFLDTKKMLIVK